MSVTDEEEIRQIVYYINAAGLDITEEEYIKDLIGVNIDKVDSETYHI